MDATIGRFFESVGSFGSVDTIPWCDRNFIAYCEREFLFSSVENQDENLMRLSLALVLSREPKDMNRGLPMLEAFLDRSSSELQMREILYILAVGYYRSGDYSRSLQRLHICLEIQPDYRQALTLKTVVEDRIAECEAKDGVTRIIGIAATIVGLVVGGIAAAMVRKG